MVLTGGGPLHSSDEWLSCRGRLAKTPTEAGRTPVIAGKTVRGLILSQPDHGYRYSLDPFLLAGFCEPRRGEQVLDLGAGSGVVGLLLARRHPSIRVTGIELDPGLASHAARNARDSALTGRFSVVRGDVRTAPRFLPPEHFHRAVANPPYRKLGSGATSPDRAKAGARHELSFTIVDLAAAAAALLRCKGVLDLIYLAERLPELCTVLSTSGLEPKKIRLVAPFPRSAPRLFLLSAIKGARPGLRFQPPLIVHERPGCYSTEVEELLSR